ncbi:MAG: bifunctional 5,10-methylene-tetrahydrofolate dehydrogenase/5,10-methylene-tetrahydrofolate cyclohydrolase, partial [Nitrospiraceae bacterium]|nr:bifunctional 5,10-methylene-tetrahydrofolate dehydrogenase/5,10-methylene-tetrahydrofolate cyclohydrolase [Nitrospiraceae bacterium]
MAAKIISGTEVATQIREELKKEVTEMKEKHGVVPGLVTILVGKNPASISYVTGKQKTAHELGFNSIQDDQPEDVSEADLLKLVDKYNKDPKVHGILVQLPLPKHIDEKKVLNAI